MFPQTAVGVMLHSTSANLFLFSSYWVTTTEVINFYFQVDSLKWKFVQKNLFSFTTKHMTLSVFHFHAIGKNETNDVWNSHAFRTLLFSFREKPLSQNLKENSEKLAFTSIYTVKKLISEKVLKKKKKVNWRVKAFEKPDFQCLCFG